MGKTAKKSTQVVILVPNFAEFESCNYFYTNQLGTSFNLLGYLGKTAKKAHKYIQGQPLGIDTK
jgi:hypothetical protein